MRKIIFISIVISFFASCKKDELKPKQLYNYTDTTYAITGTPGEFNDEIFCLYPYKSLIIDATVNDNSATYLWHPGGETTPSIEVTEETNGYNLYVEISSNTLGNIQIFVTVSNCIPAVYIPSSFTPFDDAINDYWKPVFNHWWNHGVKVVYFQIRDADGIVLYEETTDSNTNIQGWDGTYQNQNMPSGFYLYYINYSTLTTENNILTGSLELIR